MNGFWNRKDELEARLKASRPEPPPELVDRLVTRIEGQPIHRRRGMRIAVAAGLTAGALAAFGAFGGLSYAAKAVSSATGIHIVNQARSNQARSDRPDQARSNQGARPSNVGAANIGTPSPAENQYGGQHKSTICHVTGSATNPFVIITVPDRALFAHMRHGDTFVGPNGECPGAPILPILPGFGTPPGSGLPPGQQPPPPGPPPGTD